MAEATPSSRVLVVDADPLFARILKSRLEKIGYLVQTETTGAAALMWIKAEVYRIIITDSDLPDMDGGQLCRAVRALDRPQYTYVIAYTARKDKEGLFNVLEAGVDDIVHKPFDGLEFRMRLHNAERLLALDDELRFGGGIDHNTGLLNRGAFHQVLVATLAECQRSGSRGTLVFIEMTNHRDIYRQHGYEAAFQAEREVAKLLRRAARTSDLIARTGEGEFCLMLQGCTSEEAVCHTANTIVLRAGPLALDLPDGIHVDPVLNIVQVRYPRDDASAEDLLAVARTPCRQAQ